MLPFYTAAVCMVKSDHSDVFHCALDAQECSRGWFDHQQEFHKVGATEAATTRAPKAEHSTPLPQSDLPGSGLEVWQGTLPGGVWKVGSPETLHHQPAQVATRCCTMTLNYLHSLEHCLSSGVHVCCVCVGHVTVPCTISSSKQANYECACMIWELWEFIN